MRTIFVSNVNQWRGRGRNLGGEGGEDGRVGGGNEQPVCFAMCVSLLVLLH